MNYRNEEEYYQMMHKGYTGKFHDGDITNWRGHEVVVLKTWNVDGKNGVTIRPTLDYGFELDVFEERYWR